MVSKLVTRLQSWEDKEILLFKEKALEDFLTPFLIHSTEQEESYLVLQNGYL